MKKVLLKIYRGGKLGGLIKKEIQINTLSDKEAKEDAERQWLKDYLKKGSINYLGNDLKTMKKLSNIDKIESIIL